MNERVYEICEEMLIYNVVKNYCMYDRVCIFFRKKKEKRTDLFITNLFMNVLF